MQKKRKNARENKMHEDDNKHSIKEMECKKKRKKCTSNKMHERNKNKMQRGAGSNMGGAVMKKKVRLGQ